MTYDNFIYILNGASVTLFLSIMSVFFGFLLGSIIAFAYYYENIFFKTIAKIYVSIFRGTPMLIQLSIIYYALPQILSIRLSIFEAGILSFSLNSAAYVSEILRSGIESIDKGQIEAAQSLGLNKKIIFKNIILPQAFYNVMPSLVNEVINMVKETCIISMIGGLDLMKRANSVASERADYFGPMLFAAFCYYILIVSLTFISKKIEGLKKW
jgi:polar amino acid transport system permease protein